MQSIGIIAEYNPFHYGHLYHIEKIKEMYPEAVLVLVLSGNFTQRGEVSIINKWQKTEIALNAGVDLIVELPFPFATQSADFFSYGAITILEKLGVERVIFGSESNCIDDLTLIAKTQIENKDFDKLVKVYSKLGENYPTALSNALFDITGKRITTPNDLLGVSYLKMILKNNYHIQAETIKRKNNFHDKNLSSICSASAIRNALQKNENIKEYVPNFVFPHLQTSLHFQDQYFQFLKYKIITEDHLEKYHLVEEGIEKKLKKEVLNSSNYESFITNIKSKRYTYNKIQRTLNSILCNFTKEQAKNWQSISYIRILGFSNKGQTYLNYIKKEIDIPLISKIRKNKDTMLEFELETTKIYALSLPSEEQIALIESEYKNHFHKGE